MFVHQKICLMSCYPLQVRSYSAAQVGGMAKKPKKFSVIFSDKDSCLERKSRMYCRHILHILFFFLKQQCMKHHLK